VEGDYVLCCAGRVANYENLGLEELGIEASRRGIVVDDHLRTSVPTIFASGDVIDKQVPRLTPTAEFESNYIAAQILGDVSPICYPVVPNLVFTLSRIAQVGVTLSEAEANADAYRIDEWHYGPQNEWVDNRELDIDMTLVQDNDGHLVGAAIYGSEAGTWIDFLTLVINAKLTGADIRKRIFAFPTQTYMLASHLAMALVAR
jgi:glutathione reductase (NADPH)